MAYPAGITLRTVKVGGATALESGEPLTITVRFAASRPLIWGATGWRFPSVVHEVAGTVGNEISVDLPITNQAGWRTNSNQVIDVSAAGSYTHTYTATVTTTANGRVVSQDVIGPFALPTGDGTPVDLDLTLPTTTVAGGVVQVPDTWDAKVAAAEAAAADVNKKIKTWDAPGMPDRPNILLGGQINGSGIEPTAIHSVMLQPGGPGYNNIIGGDGTATVGTSTPNTVSPTASNVSVALVGGYDNVVGSIADKIISDHSYTEMGGAGHNAIFGGQGHIIRATAKHAGIYGGDRNVIAKGFGFATGLLNQVLGQSGCAAGESNVVGADARGSQAFGVQNSVTGAYGRVSGYQNEAAGAYSVAEGQQAATRGPWQRAYAAGQFTKKGDAQAVDTVFRHQTTDAAVKVMGAGASGLGPLLQPNSSVTFTMQVLAIEPATGATKAWRVEGTTRRGATGGLVHVGTPTITSAGADADAAAWVITCPAGGSGYLVLTVQGEAAKTINWAARVTYTELVA